MKAIYSALILLGAAPLGAQGKAREFNPTVEVTSVESTMAYERQGIHIWGKNLDLVRQVQINDLPVPVLLNTGRLMVLAPDLQDPGFARLELLHPRGTVKAGIEFLPTVLASSTPERMDVSLHAGEPGGYWLSYSLDLLPTPIAHKDTYYFEMLDMKSRYAGLLAKGASDGEQIQFSFPIPARVALLHPIHVQGLCFYKSKYESSSSFSNVATSLPMHPRHERTNGPN